MYGTADGVDPDEAQHAGADHGDQSLEAAAYCGIGSKPRMAPPLIS